MCNTPIFYFNLRCQIENQVSDYRLLGASSLAHLAKGHVSFCHHLASVVRRKLSHLNLLL